MIITEKIMINGRECNRKYSNEGFYIQRDGIYFEVAVDLVEMNREYVETDVLINKVDEATEEDYQEALRKLGVEV